LQSATFLSEFCSAHILGKVDGKLVLLIRKVKKIERSDDIFLLFLPERAYDHKINKEFVEFCPHCDQNSKTKSI